MAVGSSAPPQSRSGLAAVTAAAVVAQAKAVASSGGVVAAGTPFARDLDRLVQEAANDSMQWAAAPHHLHQQHAQQLHGPAAPPAPAAAPRVFSLQKVVEVADYNMHTRSRVTWARIWDTLSGYFAAICCSPNTSIAMYAIDSLKQLALKFLEKPELRSFHFQTKFLQVRAAAGQRGPGAGPPPPSLPLHARRRSSRS